MERGVHKEIHSRRGSRVAGMARLRVLFLIALAVAVPAAGVLLCSSISYAVTPAVDYPSGAAPDTAIVGDVVDSSHDPLFLGAKRRSPVLSSFSLSIPAAPWSRVPRYATMYWRVKGADSLGVSPGILLSAETWSFIKGMLPRSIGAADPCWTNTLYPPLTSLRGIPLAAG
jgi:hypothetical protein